MRDRNQNPIESILNIDENMSKQRQLRLYDNSLVFDEDRPIYQQVIKLGNYLEAQQEQVLEQFLKNTGHIHPDEETKKLAKQYLQIQYSIDRLNEGYLDELQEDLRASIDKLKKQIEQMREKIIACKKQNEELQQKAESEKSQIQILKKFMQNHSNHIKKLHESVQLPEGKKLPKSEKLPENEDIFNNIQNKFKNLMDQLLQKTKYKLKLYEDLYNQIVKLKQEREKAKQQIRMRLQILIKIKSDLKIISSAIPKAELQIEQIRQKIRVVTQQIRRIEEERRRLQQLQKNGDRESGSQIASQISRNTSISPVQNTFTRGKYYVTVRKEPKSCDWLCWILLLITFLLALATISTIL